MSTARYSLWGSKLLGTIGIALLVCACARATPPTTLVGPTLTNADDRALAKLIVLAWAGWDESDPVARDEAGVRGTEQPWPAADRDARARAEERSAPVRLRFDQLSPSRLSAPWRAAHILLGRRLQRPPEIWDALDVQALVGRGLWAALGPQAWPVARSADRLDALDHFLTTARSATVATTRARIAEALELLDEQRTWIRRLQAPSRAAEFARQRRLAVAALDVHEMRLQDSLPDRDPTTRRMTSAWTGRWAAPPPPEALQDAVEATLSRIQKRLLALVGAAPSADGESASEALNQAEIPSASSSFDLDSQLAGINGVIAPRCPAAPRIDSVPAPPALRGLALLRLDEVQARTSTTSYRLWLSTDDSPVFEEVYPVAKQVALALYEGWPGRALYRWATTTRPDRGLMERRWPDPILSAGWPLFALDELLRPDALPRAVRWHVGQLLLRAVVDAQVDLWMQSDAPPDDPTLLRWLTDVGMMTPAEAQAKLETARVYPGRLSAPFIGWWTLRDIAKAHISREDPQAVRRLAGCAEWPPDLVPECLRW